MQEQIPPNRTIARNTIILYFRTLIVLLVSLYSSRILLKNLGVSDYGVYMAVGGVVSMLSVLTGTFANSISRFITYGLGQKDLLKLNNVFVTCVNVTFLLSVAILLVCETAGIWFLNNKMSIPEDRFDAANWVLQCSLITFVISLINAPYNACIIAHEKMSIFAVINICETLLRLFVIILIQYVGNDKLISYSIFLVAVSLFVLLFYRTYCHIKFSECKYKKHFDKHEFKKILSFAGWGFSLNASAVFNTQGITLLMNIYYGVAMNAARGVTAQVSNAVNQFVNSFTTAINPQIIKSYAENDLLRVFDLICKGAKYSYFLLFIIIIPLLCEIDTFLSLWLEVIPDTSGELIKLALIGSLITCTGNSGYTACMATGNIKKYSIVITLIGLLDFFLTWLLYALGFPAISTYWVYIIVYFIIQIVRLYMMKQLIGFPPILFFHKVIKKILGLTLLSPLIPIIIVHFLPQSFLRLCVTIICSIITSLGLIYLLGLEKEEKRLVNDKFKESYEKILCK